MRERHADTVRFHKSHRPKMTVARLVIGLLLLVFPSQLTAVGEPSYEMAFSYVLSYIGAVYHNFYFTGAEDSSTALESASVDANGIANFFLHIETNDPTMEKVTFEFGSFAEASKDESQAASQAASQDVRYDVKFRNFSDSGRNNEDDTWDIVLQGESSYLEKRNYLYNGDPYDAYTDITNERGDDHYLFQMQIVPNKEDLNAFSSGTELEMTIRVTGNGI